VISIEFFSRCQDETRLQRDYLRYARASLSELEAEREQLDLDTLGEREEALARERESRALTKRAKNCLREKKRSSFGSLITGAVELLERDAVLRARPAKQVSLHIG